MVTRRVVGSRKWIFLKVTFVEGVPGGAHSDLLKKATNAKTDRHELIHDLAGHVRADIRAGLHFELLSIGQAVGRSDDIDTLISAIRSARSA